MKTAFSNHWKSSKQPRKQRKFMFNAPLHIRGTFLHSHLDKPLREKYETRSLRVRSGDEIRILRGQYKGRTGKVDRVDIVNTKIYITEIEQVRRDGSKKQYPLRPSNLMITKLADDKRRLPGATKPVVAKPAKVVKPVVKKPAVAPAKAKEEVKKEVKKVTA